MPTRNIIEDGYTRALTIAAVPGLHEGLTGRYRPMLPEQVEDLLDVLERCKPKEGVSLLAAALVKQLVEWSEVDKAGKPIAITVDGIRRLPRLLLRRLRAIVTGMEANDLAEGAAPEQIGEYEQELRAAMAGENPGLATLREQQGN